ncbi:RDD family protein [Streptomyces sp900129855]|uniref:RDD family protein n=1 Tax=Streptomyces sp. 900129855 TaxID=3155129 RepID=A0ABV2ZBK7_9ACTN
MSAPTPAPGDDRPREGYYPDPSIPGYVRYWNGAAWVPGTSRPAPSDGRPLTPPSGAPPASVEETGPHFFDEDPAPADPYDGRPEPASAWGADSAHQSGFGGDQDRRVSWGGGPQTPDPRVPSPAPAHPEGRSTSTDGTATIPPAEPEDGSGDVVSGGTFVFRRPTAGNGGAAGPAGLIPDEGTVTFRAPAPRTGDHTGASGAHPGSTPGSASPFPPAARATPGFAAQGPAEAAAPGSLPPGFGAQGPVGASGTTTPGPAAGSGSTPGPAAGSGLAPSTGFGSPVPVGPTPASAAPAGTTPINSGPAGSGPAGGPAQPGFGAGKAAAERAAAQGAGVPAPQGPAGFPAAQSAAPPAAQAPGVQPAAHAPGAPAPAALSGPQQAAPSVPHQSGAPGVAQPQPGAPGVVQPQSGAPGTALPQAAAAGAQAAGVAGAAPLAAGSGGGQPSWAQQVHRLAGAEDGPVAPWKPPVEDIFQAAARRQASARPAGLGKRLAARLVDTLVLAAVTSAAAVPLGVKALDHVNEKIDAAKLTGETVTVWLLDGTTSVYLAIVLGVLLVFGVVYEALPTAKWGRTLGKKLFGLEVRDIEGGEPPSFGAALRRWLVYSVPGLLVVGVVGVVWGLFDKPWRQCWHDKAAHTFVAG